MTDDKILHMDDYRPHVRIVLDNGTRHSFTQEHLQAIADGHAPISDLPDEVVRSIVAQWIYFIPIIDEYAQDESGEI